MKDALGHGSNARGQLSARAERVALNRRIDEAHFPTRSTADKVGALDQTIPTSGTQRVINNAQSAARAGLGVHSAAVHQVGKSPLTTLPGRRK